ncbi:MAG: hypothetical protein ACYDB3_06795, partial [Acidimicrobiales bacterium]
MKETAVPVDRGVVVGLAALVVAWSLAGCTSSGPGNGVAPTSVTSVPGLAPTSPASPTVTTAALDSIVVTPGPGWSAGRGLEGRVPGPGACHSRRSADGRWLPDPTCTPGAVDSTVTPADLGSTICRSGGYTYSVRP